MKEWVYIHCRLFVYLCLYTHDIRTHFLGDAEAYWTWEIIKLRHENRAHPCDDLNYGPDIKHQWLKIPQHHTLKYTGFSHHSKFGGADWGWWSSEPLQFWSCGRLYLESILTPPCCCSEWVFSLCCWTEGGCLSMSEQRICQFGIPATKQKERLRGSY